MAFANLFTRLSAVAEDVNSPGQPASTYRNETDNGRRGDARKRKTQREQTGPYKTKRCYQAQTTRTYNARVDDSKATHHHMHNTDGAHASVGITKEGIHNPNYKRGNVNMCHKGQSYQAKNRNVKKQREQKKTEGQKKPHQQKDRPTYRDGSHQTRAAMRKGGGDRKNTNNKQDFHVKHTRFMTQEFKDHNVLMVDGRLLCRHFLRGRCIKGDECQLEHVQGYNDLIKNSCKFYIQGLCTKGGSCPYMHKSFPCKFFHRKGKCSQGPDCRFSHEPLNDVTAQLLDEALKRDNDVYELANKAEQESSGQPANTDEFVILETNRTPDIFLQPLRPNFYKSTDTNTEKETSFCPTDEPADIVEEAVPPCASDEAQHHSPSSNNLNPAEPVCYSVEAVLGPQLSRPFNSLFPTPQSKEFTPLSSSDCTSDSASQTQVPYSVDAVLKSCKSSSLPPHTGSYTSKTYLEEISYPLLSPEMQNKKVLCSVNTINEASESQESLLLKRPFHSLFTSPVTTDDSESSRCPQGSVQSSFPIPQSEDCRSNHVKTLEPDKASARSFISLFASPLSAAPLPCSFPQSVDNPSHSSDSKQSAANLEICLLPTSPNFSPNPKMGSSSDHINPPTERLVNTASSIACGDAHKQLPDISSHIEEATANSVFKTLFLCLSPYQQDGQQEDGIQISVPLECEKDKNGTQHVFVKQQRKSENKGRQKKLKTEDTHKQSTEKMAVHSREHQPTPQISQISSEATGLSTLSSPGMPEPQVKDSGTHNLPFKPMVSLMPRHIQPRLKHKSEEGKCVNAILAATPLKDLFKSLDTAVFHIGH